MLYSRKILCMKGNYAMTTKQLMERFTFRDISVEEIPQAVEIEQICFPPHEACSPKMMRERIERVQDVFLVAVDQESGKIAGFLSGLATDETAFHDGFFTDAGLHNPNGKYIMILGLDVLPAYRGQGLARELMNQYYMREQAKGRKALILTCLDDKVEMYKKMQFVDDGIANSTWGGETWHQMTRVIE